MQCNIHWKTLASCMLRASENKKSRAQTCVEIVDVQFVFNVSNSQLNRQRHKSMICVFHKVFWNTDVLPQARFERGMLCFRTSPLVYI
jgi:hypothetical protein